MKTSLRLAAAALLAATACTPAMALPNIFTGPTGYQAGDIMVHLSAIGVLPENLGSNVSQLPGFRVKTSDGVSPEIDGSYFFTPHLSLQLIAASTRHNVSVSNGAASVKVGATWVLPPTLTLQYHFAQIGRVRPYAGIGITVAFFYGQSPSNGSGFTATHYSTGVGPALDAGFDVPIVGNWSVNVDVKQMFIVTAASVNHGAVHAITQLDPTVVGVGVGYKF